MERRLSPLAAPTQVAPPVISVFIPARNEAGNLAPLFEKISNAFHTMRLDGEVILVDDGSTDTTWSEALACAERFPFVRLYRHRTSLGVTEAMRTGFRHSRGDAGLIALEPHVGGRVFESFTVDGAPHVVEIGRIRVWQPPRRLLFDWQVAQGTSLERTEVEVLFEPAADNATRVTVQRVGERDLARDLPLSPLPGPVHQEHRAATQYE